MTDERYVYKSDIRERKGMASGARGVKNGSRSKRCSLPSDGITPTEWKKLNGPVEYAKLGVPMTYSELMDLSPSLRFLYLDHCVNHYHARQTDLIQMLGCCQATFFKMSKNLPGKLTFKGRSRKVAPEWSAFLAKERSVASQGAQDAAPAPQVSLPSSPPQNATQAALASVLMAGSVTVTGTLSDAVAMLRRVLCQTDGRYVFTLSFEEVRHD